MDHNFLMPSRKRIPAMKMSLLQPSHLWGNKELLHKELVNYNQLYRKYKIKSLKLREPVKISTWFFDYFEQLYHLLDLEKKRKIKQLKIKEPVKISKWVDE